MAPWRLGTWYDRPIPRRIAESTGLSREMFGQVKMASVYELVTPRLPFGESLRREFLDDLVAQGTLSRWQGALLPLGRRWNRVLATTTARRHRWNYYAQRAVAKATGRPFAFPLAFRELNGAIFRFCVNRIALQYRAALSGALDSGDRATQN
jgi:hypothetical protein